MFYNSNPNEYCMYCKDKIDEGDAYIVNSGYSYHIDCWQQMNRFVDAWGDILGYEGEEDE